MSPSERVTVPMPAVTSDRRVRAPARPTPPVPLKFEHKADPFCATQRLKAPAREARRPPAPFAGSRAADQRLALFTCAANRNQAARLLEGLAANPRKRATEHLRALLAAPSSERQGQLASAFGLRTDAGESLRALWADAGPALRRELFRLLPPYLKTLFPDYAPDEASACENAPALAAFAERLVREATR